MDIEQVGPSSVVSTGKLRPSSLQGVVGSRILRWLDHERDVPQLQPCLPTTGL